MPRKARKFLTVRSQAKRARLRRASESFEAREARLEKIKLRTAHRREKESADERAVRLEKSRLRRVCKLKYESADEREARLEKDRLRTACRRENESADEREARLEADRIRMASKRKAEKETEHHVAREENMKAQLASQIENQNTSLGLIHGANSHQLWSLIVQMRTRHKVSEECRMVFTREDEHDEYMRTLAEGKPFACVYCGKGFTEKTDLSIHVGEHRREMGLDAEESPATDNTHSYVEMTVKDEPEEEWTSFSATGMDCEGNGTHRLTSEMCSSYLTESSVNQEIESSEFETVYVKCEDIPSCSSEMDRSPAMRDDPLISGEKDAAESDKTSNF